MGWEITECSVQQRLQEVCAIKALSTGTYCYDYVVLSMVVKVFHQQREISKILCIIGEIQMLIHVVNVIPLSVLREGDKKRGRE